MRNGDPTEKQAGAVRCLDGGVYMYHSNEVDRRARLCMVTDLSGRADVLLSPGQAVGAASAMERDDPAFLLVAEGGVLWCGVSKGRIAGQTVLGAECAFGNGRKEVCVSSEHLRQIAAALRAASSPPAGAPDGARRRTDDNLRRAFGG